MLTIAAIAKQYALPESTVRFYCKRFLAYLPHVGQGKRRRYLPEALEVFEAILAEMKNSKNASSVEHSLSQRFKVVEKYSEPSAAVPQTRGPSREPFPFDPNTLTTLLENQVEALKQIAGVLGRMLLFQDKIEQLALRMTGMETKADEISAGLKLLQKIQDDTERMHQQDIEVLRKWLAHLAREQKEKNA